MNEIQLEPGEDLIKAMRKHWFVLLLTLLPLAMLAWLPTLIIPILSYLAHLNPGTAQIPIISISHSPYIRLVYGLWLLMLWSASFNIITRYYLNEWIITSKRIISINQYGFFSREISSLLLIKVQDVNVNVDGIFGTLLSYGQLEVQSAGTTEHFIMDDIPNPNGLRDIIMSEISALHVDSHQAVGGSVGGAL